MVAPIEHPAWCDRALCTAPAERPAELDAATGRHLSAPVPLNLRVVSGAEIITAPGGGTVTAQLSQLVAPWPCETLLQIRDSADLGYLVLALALHEAREAAAVLGALLAGASDDVMVPAERDPAQPEQQRASHHPGRETERP